MTVTEKLIHCGKNHCRDAALVDIRIGLGYTYVELADGSAGIAWTPGRERAASCTHLPRAGTMQNCSENEALELLASNVHLERAIGLAVFNAVNSRVSRRVDSVEAIARLAIKPTDLVVMVGHFGPLIPRIRKIGCQLDILDLNTDRSGIIDPASGPAVLATCDVAIITATSIINATIEDLIGHLQRNRTAVLLGPSTPICPEAFAETRITQLSGSLVKEPEQLKQVISQGGGTMLMKKYLQFVNSDVER